MNYLDQKHINRVKELRKRNKTGVTATTKRDIGHLQELSFGFPPPVKKESVTDNGTKGARSESGEHLCI